MREFDLIVVGSGAGLTVLSEGLEKGQKCVLIESGKMGGTCLTRGCIPSKVLTHAADIIRMVEHSKKIGINCKMEKPDWKLIGKRMWSQIDESMEIDYGLSNIPNLTVHKGIGEFTGKYTMRVKLQNGTYTKEFRGKKIILASGGRSIIPEVPGLREAGFVTTESFFGDKFPDEPWASLILIGGGIIAAEFAHIFSAFGTRVTIVEVLPRLIAAEEREISDFVEINFQKHMEVLTKHSVVSVKANNGLKDVTVKDMDSGKMRDIEADEIFVCAGRRSNADLLKIENSGIMTYGGGEWIRTNEYLETNVPNIWAIGDANGRYMFRHKANHEADICTQNIFGSRENKKAADYSAVPWVIYTDPQVGHVGLTEQEAIDKGLFIYRAIKHYSSVAKGFAMGYNEDDYDDGFVKLVVDKSMRILGAHVAGPQAELLVQQFVYLMNSGFTCEAVIEDGKSADVSGTSGKTTGIIKHDYACPGAGSIMPLFKSMIVHPSLNEVAGWILGSLEPVNISVEHHHE